MQLQTHTGGVALISTLPVYTHTRVSESQPDVLHLFWQTSLLLLSPFCSLCAPSPPSPSPPSCLHSTHSVFTDLLTIPCVAILQIVYAAVPMTGKARELVRGYDENGFFFWGLVIFFFLSEARGAAYVFGRGSVVRNREYKHPRVHPCAGQQPTSAARVCCLNSGTHRLNNSRLSLLSLLAASAVDLHAKHTETQKVNLNPPSSHPPVLSKSYLCRLFLTCP